MSSWKMFWILKLMYYWRDKKLKMRENGSVSKEKIRVLRNLISQQMARKQIINRRPENNSP